MSSEAQAQQAKFLIETMQFDDNVVHAFHIPATDALTVGVVVKTGQLDRARKCTELALQITNLLLGVDQTPFQLQWFEERQYV